MPYTSIIDQTASIFKRLFPTGRFGGEIALEHHSGISLSYGAEEAGEAEQNLQKQLQKAMEDWDRPLIITANVQLFESLYVAKPSAVRKLKNIAGGVILLDEAPAIPLLLLASCMRVLDSRIALCGCLAAPCYFARQHSLLLMKVI